MLAASEVTMSGSEKKKRTRTQATTILVSTYDISYTRCVTGTFHVVVVQNVQESVLHLQVQHASHAKPPRNIHAAREVTLSPF